MKKFYSLFILTLTIAYSCAPTRYVKPLNKGEHAVNAHFGGPITKVPGMGSIPLPFTSIGYGYGLMENTTIFANLYTTSLLFGVSQIDIGATYRPWKSDRMGLTLQPNLNILLDLYTGANRFWPQLDANFYFDYKSAYRDASFDGKLKSSQIVNSLYGGISNWFDLYPTESQGRKNEQFWIPSIQLGHLWERRRLDFQLEIKILAPIYSNKNIVVDYPSILGSYGALGAYFGIHYKF